MKLVIGITAPSSVILIKGQASYFANLGYTVYLLAPDDDRVRIYCKEENCIHLPVSIEREISIIKDLKSFLVIVKHLKKVRPEIINVGTPKMGLLGLMAAKLLGIRKRIYTCRGFRFEHEKGSKRSVLISMEKLTSFCSQNVICISPSLRELGIRLGLFPTKKAIVLHYGSSNGVNLELFKCKSINQEELIALKNELQLQSFFTFGFVGRLIDRKGINELYAAFDRLFKKYPNVRLLIVGSVEASQIADKAFIHNISSHPAIKYVGPQNNVPLYLSLMDVFVLPAWWEGFGNVLVQAAAMKLPIISTDATGTRDAVKNGYNGILVPPFDKDAVFEAMEQLLNNHDKRKQLGQNGLIWAENFKQERIWNAMHDLYKN